jgi:hypothetical protein
VASIFSGEGLYASLVVDGDDAVEAGGDRRVREEPSFNFVEGQTSRGESLLSVEIEA